MGDEELARYPGLQRRSNGIWYIRKRVPVDLVATDSRGSVRISLDTTERRVAVSRYALRLAEITAGFERKRKEIAASGSLSSALALGRVELLGKTEIEHLVAEWWKRRIASSQASGNHDDDDLEGDARAEREELDLWVSRAEARGEDFFATVADHLLVEAGFVARPHVVGNIKTQRDC